MLFWTREEYTKFSEAMMDKPLSFYAFEVLYWCGVREGELLALTPADFDFEKRTLTINKSYQRLNKQDRYRRKSVRRTRSHRMKFCVQKGVWGQCPQQADGRKCECV